MENPIKMGWFGGTPIFGNTHLWTPQLHVAFPCLSPKPWQFHSQTLITRTCLLSHVACCFFRWQLRGGCNLRWWPRMLKFHHLIKSQEISSCEFCEIQNENIKITSLNKIEGSIKQNQTESIKRRSFKKNSLDGDQTEIGINWEVHSYGSFAMLDSWRVNVFQFRSGMIFRVSNWPYTVCFLKIGTSWMHRNKTSVDTSEYSQKRVIPCIFLEERLKTKGTSVLFFFWGGGLVNPNICQNALAGLLVIPISLGGKG